MQRYGVHGQGKYDVLRLVTGFPDFESALQAIRNQVDDYLTKSADIKQLFSTIRENIRKPRSFSPIQAKRVSTVLREQANHIVEEWLAAANRDKEVSRIALSKRERINHLPAILAELADQVDAHRFEAGDEAREAARAHGHERRKQGYNADRSPPSLISARERNEVGLCSVYISMKSLRVLYFPVCFLLILTLAKPLIAGPAKPLTAGPSHDDLQSRIREFLDLYSKKDIAGFMNLVANDNVLVMGSDLSEICTRREQVEALLLNDFQLWDSASFGKPAQLYTRQSGGLITAFFDVPFTLRRGANEQTLVIRFATVWQKTKQGFKLVQSTNTTPTVGQSAKDLLAPKQ